MKRSALIRHLKVHGCEQLREGGNYTIYIKRRARKTSSVPRHRAVSLLLVLSGCAIHAPLSEGLLFAEDKPAPFGVGISYTIIPAGWAEILSEAERRYHDDAPRVEIDPANLRKKGVTVGPVWYVADRRAAFSLSLGAPLGADLTVRVPGSIYLTAVGSLSGGFEGIAQRVLLESEYGGLAAGLSYRAAQHSFYVQRYYDLNEPPSTYFGPNEAFFSNSLGVRVMGLVFERDHTSPFVKAAFFGGYCTTFESAVLRFSVSTGVF